MSVNQKINGKPYTVRSKTQQIRKTNELEKVLIIIYIRKNDTLDVTPIEINPIKVKKSIVMSNKRSKL